MYSPDSNMRCVYNRNSVASVIVCNVNGVPVKGDFIIPCSLIPGAGARANSNYETAVGVALFNGVASSNSYLLLCKLL